MSGHLFKVKSLYEYNSPHDDDLHFGSDQIITVTQEEDDEWYSGEYVNESGVKLQGIFPKNFVEIYEQAVPSRSTHKTDQNEIEGPQETKPASTNSESELLHSAGNLKLDRDHAIPSAQESSSAQSELNPPIVDSLPSVIPTEGPKTSSSLVSSSEKPASSPIFEKPVSSSFKDRVAAFNKFSPISPPFKPGGFIPGNSNTFVKKPFIAPPPSKNAYIPLPRDQIIPKVSRKDDDQGEKKNQLDTQGKAEISSSFIADAATTDEPKPTSLKERIALLQKQQLEQASRSYDAALKKDKSKRTAKKQPDRKSSIQTTDEGSNAHSESSEPKSDNRRVSLEDDEQNQCSRSKSSFDADSRLLCEETRASVSRVSNESHEAGKKDQNHTNDTNEIPEKSVPDRNPIGLPKGYENDGLNHGEESQTDDKYNNEDNDDKNEKDEKDDKDGKDDKDDNEDNEDNDDNDDNEDNDDNDDNEEDEDNEIDAEIRRKEELRIRMAKLGGGIGMHGIFAPPGCIQIPNVIMSPKNKGKDTSD